MLVNACARLSTPVHRSSTPLRSSARKERSVHTRTTKGKREGGVRTNRVTASGGAVPGVFELRTSSALVIMVLWSIVLLLASCRTHPEPFVVEAILLRVFSASSVGPNHLQRCLRYGPNSSGCNLRVQVLHRAQDVLVEVTHEAQQGVESGPVAQVRLGDEEVVAHEHQPAPRGRRHRELQHAELRLE
eukprot:1185118-Prorocentrum_minimum.AAC.1